MRTMIKSSWKYRSIAAVSAGALVLSLASCSGKSDMDKALDSLQSAVEQAPGGGDDSDGSGDSANDAADGSDSGSVDGSDGDSDAADSDDSSAATDDRFEGVLHPGLIADIPMVDGEFDRGMAGTLTNGGTDYQSFNITTEMDTATAGEQARNALTIAGFAEKSYEVGINSYDEAEAYGIYEKDERLIAVQTDADGRVSYDVHEMPAGSYAEKEFVCGKLSAVPVLAGFMPAMIPMQTGEPLQAERVDFTFVVAAGVMHRLPADLADSMGALRDAVMAATGKDIAETSAGTAIGDAIEAAKQDANEAIEAYCAA